jgi:hypothetical protein
MLPYGHRLPPDWASGGDVAGLVLAGEELPDGAAPARLLDPERLGDAGVRVFGYPGDPPRLELGAWALLRLVGKVGGGVMQLDGDSGAAIRAQPGNSGSPVVLADKTGDAVVGMLVVASRDRGARDSYAIPVSRLAASWPEVVGHPAMPVPASSDAPPAAPGGVAAQTEQLTRLSRILDEALRSAEEIKSASDRILITARIAVALAPADADRAARLLSGAEHDTRAIRDRDDRLAAFIGIAEAIASTDSQHAALILDDAMRLTRKIYSEEEARIRIAGTMAVIDPFRAERLALDVPNAITKSGILATIAGKILDSDPRGAARLVATARTMLELSLAGPRLYDAGVSPLTAVLYPMDNARRVRASVRIAALLGVVDPDGATQLIDMAEKWARTLPAVHADDPDRQWAFVLIAEAVAPTDPDRAALLLADAERMALKYSGKGTRINALVKVAETMTALRPDRALRALRKAEEIAWGYADKYKRELALKDVAVPMARVDPDAAERLARMLRHYQDDTIAGIAAQLAASDVNRAERLITAVPRGVNRDVAMFRIAPAVNSLDPDRAEQLAMTMEWAERKAETLLLVATNSRHE